jgi:hypothetical protein
MLVNRIIRAIKLDKTLYPEVKANEALTNEALMIIIAVIIAGAIGGFLNYLIFGFGFGRAILTLIVNGLIIGAIAIGLFIFACQFLGQALYKGTATLKEMVRSLGYAQAPALLGIFAFIPILGWLIAIVGSILALIATVIAVRETEGFDNTKAIIVCVIAFVIEALVLYGIGRVIVF